MSTRIGTLLARDGSLVFPGVYDTLSARMAERVGFELAFVSGYAVSATAIGEPDIGLLTGSEVIDAARRICRSVSIPIIVDADTGYGNALNVARTVRELIHAGAAGCFLEDQQWPKRCGHMQGKKVIPRDEYLGKIRAAVDTKGDADFFLVARTDAIADGGLDEAVARAEAARAAGADATFIEAPPSMEALAEVGRRAPEADRREHDRTGPDAAAAAGGAGGAGLQPHPLPADRPLRRRPRPRNGLRPDACRRPHRGLRGSVDHVRGLQRPDRRG